MDATKLTAQEQEKAKFGFAGATLYGINAVIGSGIFLLPKSIYKGLGPASLAIMFGVAVLVMLLSVCLAETAGYFGKNGGAMQYAKEAFGDFIGFDVGILGWAVTIIAWAAMLAGFAEVFIQTFPAFKGYNLAISITFVVLLCLMNIAGIKTSKMFTLTATVAKLIPIVLFSAFAIFYIKGGVDAGNFTPFLQLEGGSNIFNAIGSTAVYIFYGFIGFETMSIVAGEMRNPEKNVPKAILGSISIVSVLYMLIIAGTIAMLGGRIMQSGAPVQDAFMEMIGPVGGPLVSYGALISIAGLNIGESIMVPRFGAAIADEGLLPEGLGKTNSKNAPVTAILISGALAILLLLSGSFEQLATYSVVFRFFQYIPTALAVLKLRKMYPDKEVTFRVPFGPVIPVLAVAVSLLMIAGDNMMNFVWGAVGAAVASLLYYFLHGRKGTLAKE
ncbi:APC family permease [Streptococcus panodentis]|uniref:Amino acid permease n=1 Tax=Streptococcus panodentis TaxID=1581472 RepID=A0ABS5AUR3_9STRE|nr:MULTISPECIES: APC family permease [Streptococcus]KXT85802.1 putative cationic amino acid transporter protein [Streptococcus sp. DD11]MBP2619998.1 amino acid permease [Streptococcus panodentis]